MRTISIFSEYELGYISDDEFRSYGARMNREERAYTERMMALDAMKDACIECQYHDEETGECEYGFECTNCPELGTGEG